MSNERPIVVAPRPVRLASALFTRRQETDDLKLSFYADIRESPEPDRHSRPPSHSPSSFNRPPSSGLSSETLDEFLSILRPKFMRKQRCGAFPTFIPERPLAFRPLPRVDSSADIRDPTANKDREDQLSPIEHVSDSRLIQSDPDARQWFSSTLLSSPISRMNTRNPFQRYHDARSPVSISPLSPAAIPLPAPSPSEFVDNI